MLDDLKNERKDSPIYVHHIDFVNSYHKRTTPYEKTEHNQIVVDYIASMTDDYFIDLHAYLFPDTHYPVVYRGYFDDMNEKNK
jgi:dGTPase